MAVYDGTVIFDAELRVYLERLERLASAGPEMAHPVDEQRLRSHLVMRLSELEAWTARDDVASTFKVWAPRIAGFATYLSGLPSTSAAAAEAFAQRAVDVAIGWPLRELAVAERLELQHIVDNFQASDLANLEAYALENYLVYNEAHVGARLTPLGVAFLRLRGKDAIRWLLTIEMAQSTGRYDPWRTPRVLFEEVQGESGIAAIRDDRGQLWFDFAPLMIRRLDDLEVLVPGVVSDSGEVERYELAPEWRDLVRGMLAPGPWHHAIAAVLAEDRTGLVPNVTTPSEEAVAQVKMITHEVRNALIPARHNIDALLSVVPDEHSGRLEKAKRGIARVLTFVDELVATNELIAEVATSCDLAALVREALSWVDGAERINVVTSAVAARVRAPRSQLARAVANVLRNALQATEHDQAVRATVFRSHGAACLAVDDGGSGVPAEARERVFQEGYTTRSDGSGYGLAYVRRVVADQLRGRVWCEQSDLGGARFVIELPDVENER
jgi:signal transduction histidine kinase